MAAWTRKICRYGQFLRASRSPRDMHSLRHSWVGAVQGKIHSSRIFDIMCVQVLYPSTRGGIQRQASRHDPTDRGKTPMLFFSPANEAGVTNAGQSTYTM